MADLRYQTDPSDEELLERWHKGDRDAFTHLVERHQHFVYRAAYGFCGDGPMAEEAVQEVFVGLASRPLNYSNKGPNSFRRWLYSVVGHKARNIMRGERRKKLRVQSRGYKQRVRQRTLEHESRTRAEAAFDKDTDTKLRNALQQLPPELRLPIVLHFVEQVPQREIGRMSGMTLRAVQKRIAKGLKMMRQRLEGLGIASAAVVLPQLLERESLLEMPAGLLTELARQDFPSATVLTSASAASAGPAGSSGSSAFSAYSSRAAIGSSVAWWPAVAVVCLASAAVGSTWWLSSKGKHATAARGGSAAERPQKPASLNRRWTFKEGPAKDLKLMEGNWQWRAAGQGFPAAMMCDLRSNSALVLPVKFSPADGPFFISLTFWLVDRVPGGMGATWMKNGKPIFGQMVKRPFKHTAEVRRYNIRQYYSGRWVLGMDGENLNVICRHEVAWPSERIVLQMRNCYLEEIELRYLSAEKLPTFGRDLEKLFISAKNHQWPDGLPVP